MKSSVPSFLIAVGLLAATPMIAQVPDAPKPHLDRTDWVLLAADAGSRALDTYSTHWALTQYEMNSHGVKVLANHEMFLPGFVANHTPVLAGVEAGMVAADFMTARYLVRHHHPRLAKVALMADFAQNAPWAIHNLYLSGKGKK